MGLDEEQLTDVWKDWTPNEESAMPDLSASATAFDYWQVTDEEYLETVWAAFFALLSEARSMVSPADYDPTFRMLMTVLEPEIAAGPRRLDITFIAAKSGSEVLWEGVAFRLWRELPSGATPAVSILLRRSEGGAESPDEALVWFHSGYDEASSMSMRLAHERGNWEMFSGPGIATTAGTAMDGEADALGAVLLQSFWAPIVGSAYLETPIEVREKREPTPAPLPVAAGLELGDRDIEQVFSDSVFAPRLTTFE